MRLKQKLLNIVANPNVAYLLMMAGLLGLYVEFTHPGVFFPGVAGGICLLLGMAALQVLPINYSGLALIGLGLALLISGAVRAQLRHPRRRRHRRLRPRLAAALRYTRLRLSPWIGTSCMPRRRTFGGFTLLVSYLVVRSQRRKPSLGSEGLVGEIGEVKQQIAPGSAGGKIFVHGEYWNAVADRDHRGGYTR